MRRGYIWHRVERWRGFNYPGGDSGDAKAPFALGGLKSGRQSAFLPARRGGNGDLSGRGGEPDCRSRVDEANRQHNDDLARVALKMATGTGKTVVMAMLIAWQTANKAYSRHDTRFANQSSRRHSWRHDPGSGCEFSCRPTTVNYYRQRDLVPPDLWDVLADATISITNYHTFLLPEAKEIRRVPSNTRKLGRRRHPLQPLTSHYEPEPLLISRISSFGTLRPSVQIPPSRTPPSRPCQKGCWSSASRTRGASIAHRITSREERH
jgi:hypothetical protein